MTDHGKWSNPGVPHKGWTCVDFEDLGELSGRCEMCETQEIRYVHHMEHPDYEGLIGAGCDCAAKMSEDYEGTKERERVGKSRARRRATWLDRNWKISGNGNPRLRADGFVMTVFRQGNGWGALVLDTVTEKKRFSKRTFATENDAKLATFDGLTKLKAEWRSNQTS